MRVLVTGGAGFIGSHLTDRLIERGDEVRILDSLDPQAHTGPPEHLNEQAELVLGDVRDRDAVRRCLQGVDRVVHLAAAVAVTQSMYEIERFTSVNTVGAAVVLEQAISVANRLEKVVVASSMGIYGEGLYRCPAEGTTQPGLPRPAEQLTARRWELVCPSCGAALEPVPTPEDVFLRPPSIYAVNKRDQEEMFLLWGNAYGVPATALRFFNTFGPRQQLSNPYSGVVAIFAARLLNRRPPLVFEDGLQTRDFIYIENVASALAAALEPGSGDGKAINIGSGRGLSILDLGQTIATELGVEIEPEVLGRFRTGDIRHCTADISLAREELGFSVHVPLEEGVRRLATWLADQEPEDRVDDALRELEAHRLTH